MLFLPSYSARCALHQTRTILYKTQVEYNHLSLRNVCALIAPGLKKKKIYFFFHQNSFGRGNTSKGGKTQKLRSVD